MELMVRFYNALIVQMSENIGTARLVGAAIMIGSLFFLGLLWGVIISGLTFFMIFRASSK